MLRTDAKRSICRGGPEPGLVEAASGRPRHRCNAITNQSDPARPEARRRREFVAAGTGAWPWRVCSAPVIRPVSELANPGIHHRLKQAEVSRAALIARLLAVEVA